FWRNRRSPAALSPAGSGTFSVVLRPHRLLARHKHRSSQRHDDPNTRSTAITTSRCLPTRPARLRPDAYERLLGNDSGLCPRLSSLPRGGHGLAPSHGTHV